MKLIAVVGMTGSGKTELSSLFVKKGFLCIRFGDITEEIIKGKGLDVNEENERHVRESLRKEHGMHAYAKLNLPKIEEMMGKGNTVIDGLYSWEEYIFLQEHFKKELTILAVYAPPETRYERLVDRETRSLTREQAQARDKKEVENLNKGGPIAMADYTILNVGTLFDLKNNFDKFIEWMKENDEAKEA